MSSLKDLASLIMVPSLYKDGRLDTVKPLGNGILHPDSTGNNDGTDGSTPAEGNFTFSRGSNLAATRVDANGLIEKGRENLLLQSNQFDTSWSTLSSSITGGQSGYDGGSNAWLLQATASSAARLQQGVSLTGVHTTSIYAKAGTTDWIAVQMWSNHFAYFDVANGVLGSVSALDASIESVGNGFYRCSISYNASSVGNLWVYVIDGNGSTSVTSGKNVYLQSAQVEQGLVATDYIETGASTAQAGILEDMPRLDYSGGASCPSLLLEPSRTNMIDYSEYLDGAPYKSRVSIANNAIVSPEGVQNAGKVVATSVSGTHALDYVPNVVPSDYTMSVYAKAGEYSKFLLLTNNRGSNEAIGFDLNDESTFVNDLGYATPSADKVSIEAVGNDWYKCSMRFTKYSSGGSGNGIYLNNNAEETTFTGNDSDGMYFWGWQMEAGSYPTSYIPTNGSSVTRSLDSAVTPNLTADGVATNPNAWTFVVKGDWTGNGAPANNHTFSRQEGGFMYRYGGSMGFSGATKTYWTEYNPTAATAYIWDGTQLRIRREGSDIRTISAAAIGWNSGGISNWSLTFVNIRNIQYEVDQVLLFNSVLTDSEIDQLTA